VQPSAALPDRHPVIFWPAAEDDDDCRLEDDDDCEPLLDPLLDPLL